VVRLKIKTHECHDIDRYALVWPGSPWCDILQSGEDGTMKECDMQLELRFEPKLEDWYNELESEVIAQDIPTYESAGMDTSHTPVASVLYTPRSYSGKINVPLITLDEVQ